MGDGFLVQKTIFIILTCLTLIHVFCAGSNHYLAVIFFLLILIISLLKPFFLQLHLLLSYHLIFRNISLNSQEQFILLSVMFHLIFNGFSFIFLIIWAIFELSNLYSFIYFFIYSSYLFELFSYLVIFISCSC